VSSPSVLSEPLFFGRTFVEKVWGGGRLPVLLDGNPPFPGPVGESWELSDVPGKETPIRGGIHDGKLLHQILEEHPRDLLGESKPDPRGRFPLLVKFLEAEDRLSVQVHPPDGPLSPNGVGKNEAWAFLETVPGSSVICGLKEDVDLDAFAKDCDGPGIETHLRKVEVQAGDLLPVPSGTVHAILPGVVLCEFQQTNDVTFRIYDWDREGLDGNPRETHREQALEVMAASQRPEISPSFACPHFSLEKFEISDSRTLNPAPRARAVAILGGRGTLAWEGASRGISTGTVFMLPAASKEVHLEAVEGPLTVLIGEAL